jgi:hypothetical protein
MGKKATSLHPNVLGGTLDHYVKVHFAKRKGPCEMEAH